MIAEMFANEDFKKFEEAPSSSPGSSSSDLGGDLSSNYDFTGKYNSGESENDFMTLNIEDVFGEKDGLEEWPIVSPNTLLPVVKKEVTDEPMDASSMQWDTSSGQSDSSSSPSHVSSSIQSDVTSNHSTDFDDISWESLLPNNFSIGMENDLSDDFIDTFAKDDFGVGLSAFDELTELDDNKPRQYYEKISNDVSAYLKSERTALIKSYLDSDHCYCATPKPDLNEEGYYSPPSSPLSTTSSDLSEEVDVVTLSEEFSPVVPKVEVTRRRAKRGLAESQITKQGLIEQQIIEPKRRGRRSMKKAQTPLSAKSLKAAIKNNRITNVRRTYNRRKGNNSVETSPSNSAFSSQCNSDAEDADKRANHNYSERKRREIQRINLSNLRLLVPVVQNNPKASKLQILNTSREYIFQLENHQQNLKLLKKQENQKRRHKKNLLKSLQEYFEKFH